MKGLLLKDMYVLTKQMRIFLFMILVFAIVPGNEFIGFAIMYTALLPITAMAYDAQSKWDELAAMMPYSTSQLVLGKYLLSYIMVAGAGLLALVSRLLFSLTGLVSSAGGSAALVLLYLCAALILSALELPLMFRFGVEKGRMLFILLAVIAVVLCTNQSERLLSLLHTGHGFTWSLAAVTILANALSLFLSIKLYERKNR